MLGASSLKRRSEDIAYVSLDYDDGVIAHLHVNWLAPVKVRTMILGGAGLTIASSTMRASSMAASGAAGFADAAPVFSDPPAGPVVESSAMIVSSALTRFQTLTRGPFRISGLDGEIIPPLFVYFL